MICEIVLLVDIFPLRIINQDLVLILQIMIKKEKEIIFY